MRWPGDNEQVLLSLRAQVQVPPVSHHSHLHLQLQGISGFSLTSHGRHTHLAMFIHTQIIIKISLNSGKYAQTFKHSNFVNLTIVQYKLFEEYSLKVVIPVKCYIEY